MRDLDLDILSADLLRISDIIRSCTSDERGEVPDRGFFHGLPVGKQIQCLVTIALAGGSSDLAVPLKCSNDMCGQSMEVTISLDEINALQEPFDDVDSIVVPCGEREYQVRKPIVHDLLFWSRHSYDSEEEAGRSMVENLLRDASPVGTPSFGNENHEFDKHDHGHALTGDHIISITKALEDNDPLVNFKLPVVCPHCGKAEQYPIDLESLSLHRIDKIRNELLLSIHTLASRYHWSESDILSLPSWRRSRYLSFCEQGEKQ